MPYLTSHHITSPHQYPAVLYHTSPILHHATHHHHQTPIYYTNTIITYLPKTWLNFTPPILYHTSLRRTIPALDINSLYLTLPLTYSTNSPYFTPTKNHLTTPCTYKAKLHFTRTLLHTAILCRYHASRYLALPSPDKLHFTLTLQYLT